METRWVLTATFPYGPDEDGRWQGHWIGRAWDRHGRLRGLSFASRRLGRAWAFWIGGDR